MVVLRIFMLFVLSCQLTFGQEYARVLDERVDYVIYNSESVEIQNYSKVRINSKHGHDFSIFQDYTDTFRKIKKLSIIIYDENGNKVKKLGKIDGHAYGYSNSYSITDSHMIRIDPEYRNYPFTIEISYTATLEGFIDLGVWNPRSSFNLAVDKSIMTVSHPEDLKINFREEFIKGESVRDENQLVHTYRAEKLPSIDKKMRYKDFHLKQPKVYITPEKFSLDNVEGSNASWKTFGNWFLELNSDSCELVVQTKEFINGLVDEDEKNKVRRIYEYMQDKTRYVSIQLGIGGFKSLPTEEVEEYGYGDCKALTTYMKNMLDYANVNSNYVLVRAGSDKPDVIEEHPSNQFNHVYLGIPSDDDTLYLECTSQIIPSNYTGKFTDDRNVLWIEQDNSSIIRSRIYSHENNIQKNLTNVNFDEEGNAHLEINSKNEGVFFDEIMLLKNAPDYYILEHNQKKYHYRDYTIRDFKFDQPERSKPKFNSTIKIDVNGLGQTVGDRLVIPAIPAKPMEDYIDANEMMKFFSVKRGLTVIDSIEIQMPPNYWIQNLSEKQVVESEYGSYRVETNYDGVNLVISRKMVVFKGNYTEEYYDTFKTFFDRVEKIEKRKLVLNTKT